MPVDFQISAGDRGKGMAWALLWAPESTIATADIGFFPLLAVRLPPAPLVPPDARFPSGPGLFARQGHWYLPFQ